MFLYCEGASLSGLLVFLCLFWTSITFEFSISSFIVYSSISNVCKYGAVLVRLSFHWFTAWRSLTYSDVHSLSDSLQLNCSYVDVLIIFLNTQSQTLSCDPYRSCYQKDDDTCINSTKFKQLKIDKKLIFKCRYDMSVELVKKGCVWLQGVFGFQWKLSPTTNHPKFISSQQKLFWDHLYKDLEVCPICLKV